MNEEKKPMIDLEEEIVVDSVEEREEEVVVEDVVEAPVEAEVEVEEAEEIEVAEEADPVDVPEAEVEADVEDTFEEAEADAPADEPAVEVEEVEEAVEEVVDEQIEEEEILATDPVPTIALDASFEELREHFAAVQNYYEQTSNEILELRQRLSTLETEASDLQASLEQYQRAEKEALNSQKHELIDSYADLLSADAMNNFKETAENYSLDALKKEILFKIDEENPSFFKRTEEPKAFSSFRTKEENGIIGILNKHKNKI